MVKFNRFVGLCVAVAASAMAASNALAVGGFGSITPTKANGTFIPGTGIPGGVFTLDTAGTGEQVGIKARDRSTGNPLAVIGNRYFVSPGNQTPTRTAWNFEFQFSPGAGSIKVPTDYTYELKADMDPAFGSSNFTIINVPADNATPAAPAGDSYFANPGGSVWSDNTVPFVIANSENYMFAFLGGPSFDNSNPGEYELVFTAKDAITGLPVASVTAFAVVPEPASVSLVGLGVGAAMLRRTRRKI